VKEEDGIVINRFLSEALHLNKGTKGGLLCRVRV